MGLAATQARFLLLTARQSDVEAQMQSITNQKLALARNSSTLSAKHAKALSAQSLLWSTPNSDGSASASEMKYSDVMNVGSNYMLTNSYGAMMLNSAMMNKLGLNATTGTGADFTSIHPSKEEFVKQMTGFANADAITTALADEAACDTSAAANNGAAFTVAYDEAYIKGLANLNFGDNQAINITEDSFHSISKRDNWFSFGSYTQPEDVQKKMGAYDKLEGIISAAGTNIEAITNNLANALCTYLTNDGGLGSFSNEIGQACLWAQMATFNTFTNGTVDSDATDNDSEVDIKNKFTNQQKILVDENEKNSNSNNLDFYYRQSYHGSHRDITGEVYLNRDQVVNTFLSYFDQYCEQNFSNGDDFTPGSTINTGTTNRVTTNIDGVQYGGNSGSKYCTVNGKVASTAGTGNDSTVQYWIRMYNQLAQNGWQANSQLDDSDYLQQQVLYGNMVVQEFASYNNANRISVSDSNSPMTIIDDEDAIEKENRAYEAELDAIEYKETLLDTMLQSCDAERAAITTDKESCQAIIDSNIKRVFSRRA